MKWVIAILIFSLLIIFHEAGHYIMAVLAGVDVEEFSLGFGPRLISAVRGKTRYSIKLLLFGGSCRMKGMSELLLDEDERREPEEGSYFAASVGKRAAIIIGGPLFNFILAFIAAAIVISVVGTDTPEVISVVQGSPAYEAGLRAGDRITSFMGSRVLTGRDIDTWFIFNDLTEDTVIRLSYRRADGDGPTAVTVAPNVTERYMLGITYQMEDPRAFLAAVSPGSPMDKAGIAAGDVITSVDGNAITTSESLNEYFDAHPLTAEPVSLTYERNGESYEAEVTPALNRRTDLGFSFNLGREKTTPGRVLGLSLYEVGYWIRTTVRSVASLFTGRFSVDDLSGPVGVVDIVGTTYEEVRSEGPLMTWMNMLNLIILLSANLGVMNLLPIPALDGGRLLFILIEAVTGRPVSPKIEAALQTVAAVLLLILMVYVMYNDMARLIF